MSSLPPEAMFFVAEHHYRLEDLARLLYASPTRGTVAHFERVNQHLADGRVRPGQIVILTPEQPGACTVWEEHFGEAAAAADEAFATLTEYERMQLARHYALVSDVAEFASLGLGLVKDYVGPKMKRIEFVLREIETLYQTRYRTSGGFANPNFFHSRKALFVKLDLALNGLLRREMLGPNGTGRKMKAALGLSSKSLVHQWNQQGHATNIEAFRSRYQRIAALSKAMNRVGYVSIGFTVAGGVASIAEACKVQPGSEHCRRAKYVETGRTAGAVLGGAFGGAVGTAVATTTCAIVVGTSTAGFGLPVCIFAGAATAGAVGAGLGSNVGADRGEAVYRLTLN